MDRFSITISAPRICPKTDACLGSYTYELGTYPTRKEAEADLDSWNRTYQGAWEAGSALVHDLQPPNRSKTMTLTLANLERELRALSVDAWYNSVDDPDTATTASEKAWKKTPDQRSWHGIHRALLDFADHVETLKNQATE